MKITDFEYLDYAGKVLNEYGLSKVEINDAEMKITLEKNYSSGGVQTIQPVAATAESPPVAIQADEVIDFNSMTEVTSPIVGVFYSASSPEAEPFVTIGSMVKAGDTLCVIEAMKCFNEVPASQDGKIVDICIKNGDVVEFGQVLFKMQ
ncbi:MAG: acetyl-CoA carboxylase biotin carboxyl carrier protein subunit [Defluviitaleaceae bacterium]|nr:acetyl-CoA carboxylase biotin carboxyl carrier protein subunit [Defluviitaleaceae bacterium]